MKPTIKSLWAQHKNPDRVLAELKLLPSTPELIQKWAEYAITNDLTVVFEWLYPQLNHAHNAVRLKQACVYNRPEIVAHVLRNDPEVQVGPALQTVARRGQLALVDVLYNHMATQAVPGQYEKCGFREIKSKCYAVCDAACVGRQFEVLTAYMSFPTPFSSEEMSQLICVAAEKNFTEGLRYLLQGGLSANMWVQATAKCLQPYALQSECMILLLNNIPSGTSQQDIERKVGDALQQLAAVSKLDDPIHAPILNALTPHITFEEFMRKHSTPRVRDQKDTLEYLWRQIQRDTILQHIDPNGNSGVKRRM